MIPTNIITGFLGTGKTTLIKHLLTEYGDCETWGILINEFGDVGIDKALLNEQNFTVKEIAGGCICCVTAPIFEVGLNKLIQQVEPTRIIIEPSGIGHPAKVIEMLQSEKYKKILQLEATVCTVDARHLKSKRHLSNKNFQDQINLSDILVANKKDRYETDDEQRFYSFSDGLFPPKNHCIITNNGKLDYNFLKEKSNERVSLFADSHFFSEKNKLSQIFENGWKATKSVQGEFQVISWEIDEKFTFDKVLLIKWLDGLQIQRIKGIFSCKEESFSYNRDEKDRQILQQSTKNTRIQLIDAKNLDIDGFNRELKKFLFRTKTN